MCAERVSEFNYLITNFAAKELRKKHNASVARKKSERAREMKSSYTVALPAELYALNYQD